MHDRREFMRVALSAAISAVVFPPELLGSVIQQPTNTKRRITVYKSPDCECCKKWVELVKETGWIVDVKDVDDVDRIKNRLRVPKALRSCHTAIVGRYTFEGHVPIDLVQAVMTRPRPFQGLAVPGMPVGSPGMEVPGQRGEHYQVLGFYRDGRTFVFSQR